MLEVKDLKKFYKTKGGVEVHALDGVSIKFPETGMVFLLGKSGSGKSTLLNVAGGLDKPDSGEIIVKGKSSKNFSQSDFDSYRNTFVGFIFQEYNILNEFNIETNIALALELQGKKNDKKTVDELLETVDLKGMGKRKPNTLSGGQKQRIAIARALIKQPEIIMADEPTGALDSNTGKQVLDTLKKLSETKLVIIVSHDRDFAEQYGDRIIELKDGKILTDHSKQLVNAESITSNINKIGEDTIQIKDISKLSDAEVGKIFKELKGDGEVIISCNQESVANFKKAAKISEDGSREHFKDTDLDSIQINSYDGTKTKFIKSKLPLKHAVKMGGSNLKIKPGRLIFTMFLSVIAFTMFGILSTLMFYNPAFSYASALQSEPYQSLIMRKNYNVKNSQYRMDKNGNSELEYESVDKYETNTSKEDVEKLNQNTVGLNFAGFYKISVSLGNYLKESTTLPYYSNSTLFGLSDCGEGFFISNGFSKLAGKYPTENNEIAISEYSYSLFEKRGYVDPSTSISKPINNYNDLLNSKINVNLHGKSGSKNVELKIVGIYKMDDAYTDPQFAILKKDDTSSVSQKQLDEIENRFDDICSSSMFGLGYVSTTFYDEYQNYLVENSYDSQHRIYANQFYGLDFKDGEQYQYFLDADEEVKSYYYPDSEWNCFNGYTTNSLKEEKDYLIFVDENGNELSDVPTLAMDEFMISGSDYSVYNCFYDMGNMVIANQYGYFDEDGELKYYTPYYGYSSCDLYVNYSTLDYKFEPTEGYTSLDSNFIIVGTNDEVIFYSVGDQLYDKNGNGVGNTYSLTEVNLTNTYSVKLYIDKDTLTIYKENDVNVDYYNNKYTLKTDSTKEVFPFSCEYYVDSNGDIQLDYSYEYIKKTGAYVNLETGELSLTKKPNTIFTNKYLEDTNENRYIGTYVYNGWYSEDSEGNIKYSLSSDSQPLNVVISNDISRELRFLGDKPETIGALCRYFNFMGRDYDIENISMKYPDFDVENAIKTKFSGNDMKLLYETYCEYMLITPYSQINRLSKGCIFSFDQKSYPMKFKGFVIPKENVNLEATYVVADGWKDKMIYPSGYTENEYTWYSKETTKYTIDHNAQYYGVISITDKTTEQLTFMMKEYEDDSLYTVQNRVFLTIAMVTSLLSELETIFLIVGIVMAAFSGLMLLNFISTSISYKRKEIGILRAVGARGSDVFKIYFSESGIICGICFIISSIFSSLGCIILNNQLSEGLSIKLFDFGLINIAIILAVSFVVGFIGTIFPVIKASRKPPVESIRAL